MPDPDTKPTVDATVLDATHNLIMRLSDQLDELKKKQKELNEMLKGIFEGDEDLQKAETVISEASTTAKSRRKDLNERQDVKDTKLKIVDLREDIKMVQESLNTHLLNYFQMTNSTIIDLPNGDEREILLRAQLKAKKVS